MEEEVKKLSPMMRSRTLGRPEYWTQERLDALCDRLDKWANKSDAISMTEFRCEEELSMSVVAYLKTISQDFSARYDLAKMKIANRISKKAGKGVHPIHYNRYISLYDSELQQHDMSMAAAKTQAEQQLRDAMAAEGKAKMASLCEAALSGKSPETKEE